MLRRVKCFRSYLFFAKGENDQRLDINSSESTFGFAEIPSGSGCAKGIWKAFTIRIQLIKSLMMITTAVGMRWVV